MLTKTHSERNGSAMRSRSFAALGWFVGACCGLAPAGESVAVAPGTDFTRARQPQVAVGPAGTVHVTFGVGPTIYCANSTDGGKHFAPPVLVGEHGVMALGMRR